MPLTLEKSTEPFLAQAKKDETGNLLKLEFLWVKRGNKIYKGWSSTVLGNICLMPGQLTMEINSAERAEKAQKLLNKYLKESIGRTQVLIEAMQSKLFEEITNDQAKNRNEGKRSFNSSAVQFKVAAMTKAHWEGWLDASIPALHGKTPRQAVKTKIGRERLEAILLHFERMNQNASDNNVIGPDIGHLRSVLGLN